MNFFLKMNPPTVTAQEHKISVINGKPVFYNPREVEEAREKLTDALRGVRFEKLDGALDLYVLWLFPRGSHKNGEWRITKPDTDNLEKMLKDCMTAVGFWNDDCQVARETVEKRWSDEPCGIYVSIKKLEGVDDD